MAEVQQSSTEPDALKKGFEGQWNHMPAVPIQASPFFTWPLEPMRMLTWVAQRWFAIAENSILVVVALIFWFWFQPSLEVAKTLSFEWIATIYVRNFILLLVVAGGLHLYFHSAKKQADKLKFDGRDLRPGRPGIYFQ